MKAFLVSTSLVCSALAAPSALAQGHRDGGGSAHAQQDTVNAMCPVGKEPVVPSAGTVEYKGKTIGICCPGCGKQFLAWDEARKDEFVALAVAHREPGMQDHAAHDANQVATPASETVGAAWTGPYTLDTCPVSGQKLGSMGDPVVKTYDGREVRFCCGGCIGKFEADKAGYWKKIDEKIVTDQMPFYPTETCVVSGEPLIMDGEDISINMVYGNRLVRLCCKSCKREFAASPEKFIAALDTATADAQRADYPLDTCVVAGGKLGSMGDPVEMVVAGRLLQLCCPKCAPKVEANPTKYIGMIDKAWQAGGTFMPMQHGAGHDDDKGHGDKGHGDGDDDHGGHGHGG